MAGYKKFKVERAVPLKPRDNLESSMYTNVKPFVPSYDNQCVAPNINYLLSMEYQRMWTEERLYYVKGVNPEKTVILRRGHAIKHQDKFPRLMLPDRPQQRTTKYDHVKSKYRTVVGHPPYPCAGQPLAANKGYAYYLRS